MKRSMERHRRVWQVWNWLPAFRAAAEFQSLQRAALAVSLSPSALSRAINLLERSLNEKLFNRSPTGLTLTARGHLLLVATRDAVRLVHEALPDSAAPRRLRVGAAGPVLPLLVAEGVARAVPEWSVTVATTGDETLLEQLRCGDLDFALSHQPHAVQGIESRQLPSLELVLAGVTTRGRHRTIAMSEPGFDDPSAELSASTWAEAERLARATSLPVIAPWCLLPSGSVVRPLGRSQPVFASWRTGLYAGQSEPYERVGSSVSALLAWRPVPAREPGASKKPRARNGR
ncbi:MAG: LysR family transcriptional regulator [Archangium sp.]|nr:LysR family transcriptional regulator [Archangium sp.]